MSEIEKLNMIAEWQEQYKQLIEDLDNSRKRIAELEDKLANADYQLEGRDNEITELKKSCDETQELLDKQIEATYKLDKENAELKELLKKWLQTSKASGCDNINIVTDTKQFIKDSEVEK